MAGHKYITNTSNLFSDEDEIDDETFLKNFTTARNQPNQQQSFEQRRSDIENRTLQSTQRSIGLLHETEQVGIATAEELSKQRQQLENTNKQLDDINATLRFSQKHLNGLKSVLGGLKNYLSGQKEPVRPGTMKNPSESTSMESMRPSTTTDHSFESHPVNRLRGNVTENSTKSGSSFSEQLDRNLDEMTGSLTLLKGLAIDLNQDIENQNELIDNITNKVDGVDVKIQRQNKDMNKLLGKK